MVSDLRRLKRLRTSDESRLVEGPHDLCFNQGDVVDLRLRHGELALVTCRGEIRAVLLDGHHTLNICEAGGAGTTADCLVHFIDLSAELDIEWAQHIPVPGASEGPAARAAHGRFTVRINDPLRFHAALLRDRHGDGVTACREVLAHLVPSLLAIRLAQARRSGADLPLATLTPGCLDEELAEFGLACVGLSIAFDD
jgi:hypothetical protein